MKKYLIIILGFIFTVTSCEKDDFCTQETTSNLIIKFMDYDSVKKNKIKSVDSLYVWAKDKDSLYQNAKLDSIIVPLNSVTSETNYNIATSKDSIVNLTISYDKKEEFVSRSCGYRVIFNNLKVQQNKTSKSWIDSIATEIKTTNNQQNAHIKIYH